MTDRRLRTAVFACLGAWGSWIGAYGCRGSEHVVLTPIISGIDAPTGGTSSAGSGGTGSLDSGLAPPIDSGQPDSGKPEPDSGLDPDITFDWTETLPGQGLCGPNRYAGSFTCASDGGGLFSTVFGQLTFELVDDDMGESQGVLSIADGLLSDLLFSRFEGPLTGSFDCRSRTLTAKVLMGVLAPLSTNFTAELKGVYDPDALQFAGTIAIANDQEDCTGAFEAGLVP